jgi:BON domain
MSAVRSVPTVKEDVAVTVHSRLMLAAALGLSFGQAFASEEPAKLAVDKGKPVATQPSANQKTADAVVEQLRQATVLRGYKIDVVFQTKTAELTGCVGNMMQHDEALRIARSVPGVEQVRDQLLVLGGIKQAQAAMPAVPEAVPVPRRGAPDAAAPPPGGPGFPGAAEPVPIFQAGQGPAGPPYSLTPPNMPPYAWPTYAAYNNYSRVAYPQAYPYTSWPFIGPPYPFPKVPLGWRAVKLEWEDGHWWFNKYAHCYDYWRLRYW